MNGCVDGIMLRYYNLARSFKRPGMLMSDGMQLTKKGMNVLGSKLAGFITRALNYI